MKTYIDFNSDATKEYLSEFDFEFALVQNIKMNNYSDTDINAIYDTYNQAYKDIKAKARLNNKQFNIYLEERIRKMYLTGFISALLESDKNKKFKIFNFSGLGADWAYFNYWQKLYKRKLLKLKALKLTIVLAGLSAFIIFFIKLFEVIN